MKQRQRVVMFHKAEVRDVPVTITDDEVKVFGSVLPYDIAMEWVTAFPVRHFHRATVTKHAKAAGLAAYRFEDGWLVDGEYCTWEALEARLGLVWTGSPPPTSKPSEAPSRPAERALDDVVTKALDAFEKDPGYLLQMLVSADMLKRLEAMST